MQDEPLQGCMDWRARARPGRAFVFLPSPTPTPKRRRRRRRPRPLAQTKKPKPKTVIDVLSRLPNMGVGSRVTRSSWEPHGDSYWEVTAVKPRGEVRRTGGGAGGLRERRRRRSSKTLLLSASSLSPLLSLRLFPTHPQRSYPRRRRTRGYQRHKQTGRHRGQGVGRARLARRARGGRRRRKVGGGGGGGGTSGGSTNARSGRAPHHGPRQARVAVAADGRGTGAPGPLAAGGAAARGGGGGFGGGGRGARGFGTSGKGLSHPGEVVCNMLPFPSYFIQLFGCGRAARKKRRRDLIFVPRVRSAACVWRLVSYVIVLVALVDCRDFLCERQC